MRGLVSRAPRPLASRNRSAIVAVAVLWVASLMLTRSAPAAETFGDSLGVPAATIVAYACGHPCTLSTTESPHRLANFRAPISGMVLRWGIQMGPSPSQHVSFQVLRRVETERFAGEGKSKEVTLPSAGGTYTFPTRLPVQAGDFIGLNVEGGPLDAVAVEEESVRVFAPPLSGIQTPQLGTQQAYALLLDATVAAPPTSKLISSCSRTGALRAQVSVDDDPEVHEGALHVRIDRGGWMAVAVKQSTGVADVHVPPGRHTLSFWAQDSLGQHEAARHVVRVRIGPKLCRLSR